MRDPYKGLVPYDRDDRDNFFGRDIEKEILLGKILSNRLTLLYAATGVGKSSLLGAAVLPDLEDLSKENLDVAYHRSWVDDPVAAIKKTVRQALRERKKIAEVDLEELDGPSLMEFFALCCDYSSDPMVLVLDQFEELFRYHANRSDTPFIEQISRVITDRAHPLRVVISMREDFLAELNVFRGRVPDLYGNYYRLQKLTLEQAEEAIVRPVERAPFEFSYESELLKMLTRDLAGRSKPRQEEPSSDRPQKIVPSVEGPYLQIVCGELWKRERNTYEKIIRKTTYKAMGGAETIVKRYFDGIMQGCTRSERKLATRAFIFLVTEQGTKMAYPVGVLAKILKVRPMKLLPVLGKLNKARILRDESRPEGTWYELYHDVFTGIIEEWNRAFLSRKRKRILTTLAFFILLSLVMASTVLFQWYQRHQEEIRVKRNVGVLTVNNPAGSELTLARIRHYEDDEAYPPSPISIYDQSIELEGPADYMLTAQKEGEWTVQYPIYIQGTNHKVPLTVKKPPAPETILEGMVFIPGGVFRMGDKDDKDGMGSGNELPHHDVELDAFFMDRTEVTNAKYKEFVDAGGYTNVEFKSYWGTDGWDFVRELYRKNPELWDEEGLNKPAYPIVKASWYEANAYCRWRKKRLPTEAEWEKAAGGPEGYKWPFGNTSDEAKPSQGSLSPVGTYDPNGYGLLDMNGNVWEWCSDWHEDTYYNDSLSKNPKGPDNGKYKSVRGGAWAASPWLMRVSFRLMNLPVERAFNLGFRCAKDCK